MQFILATLLFIISSLLLLPIQAMADNCPVSDKTFQAQTDATTACQDLSQETYTSTSSYDGSNLTVNVQPSQGFLNFPSPMTGFGFMPTQATFSLPNTGSLPPITLPSVSTPTFSVNTLLSSKPSAYTIQIPNSELPAQVLQALQNGITNVSTTITTLPIYKGNSSIPLVDPSSRIPSTDWSWADSFLKIPGYSLNSIDLSTKTSIDTNSGLNPKIFIQTTSVMPQKTFVGATANPTEQQEAQDYLQQQAQLSQPPPIPTGLGSPTPTFTPWYLVLTYCDINSGGVVVTPTPPVPGAPAPAVNQNLGVPTAIGCVPTYLPNFIVGLIRFLALIGGGITILLMAFGAFTMITSQGQEQQLRQGQEQLTAAIVGILFIIFSVLLLQVLGVQILQIPGFV